MINIITQAIIVTVSSWLLAKKYFGVKLITDSILVCFILSFAQIVLVLTFLGIIGRLYFFNVFITHLLVLLVILFSGFRKERPVFVKPDIEPLVKNNLILFAVSVFSAFFLVKIFHNLLNPPLDADSLLYHLAFPATWIKNGNLNTPFFIFGSAPVMIPGALETSPPSYYPINASLFFTWLILPLKSAFLADSGEIPFYFIGILAVYSILRKYNLNQETALLSGFLLMLTPNIFKQIKTASQIDVICMVLFLLVFVTLLLLKFDFNFKNAALFGITAGLFVGTKFNNLIWLAALLPLIFYTLYQGIKLKKFSAVKIISLLGVIGLMVILFGGYMFIKNFFFTGNPIFPVELKIFGKVIFKGLIDSATYRMQLFTGDVMNLTKLFREGLGVQLFALIIPCTFLPLVFYRYLKTRVPSLGEYLLLFLTPLIALILFKLFIGVYVARYFFPYLSIGLLTAVIFIIKLPYGEKYFKFVVFVSILAASFELAHRSELVLSLLLALLFFAVLVSNKKQVMVFYQSKMCGKAILIILSLGLLMLGFLNNKYNQEEFDRYTSNFSKKEAWQIDIGRSWKALNELTKGGAKVAYTGRQELYPLFGSRLKNEVKYISVNEKEITPYNRPEGRYRQIKDFTSWRENLKQYKAEYLFVALPRFLNRESEDPAKFPIEDEWAVAHPGDFQLVFGNSLSHIYKVLIY